MKLTVLPTLSLLTVLLEPRSVLGGIAHVSPADSDPASRDIPISDRNVSSPHIGAVWWVKRLRGAGSTPNGEAVRLSSDGATATTGTGDDGPLDLTKLRRLLTPIIRSASPSNFTANDWQRVRQSVAAAAADDDEPFDFLGSNPSLSFPKSVYYVSYGDYQPGEIIEKWPRVRRSTVGVAAEAEAGGDFHRYDLNPVVTYYVSTGDYTRGEVVDVSDWRRVRRSPADATADTTADTMADDLPFEPHRSRSYEIQPILTFWVAADSYPDVSQKRRDVRRSNGKTVEDSNPFSWPSSELEGETSGESRSFGTCSEQRAWLAVAGAIGSAALALA